MSTLTKERIIERLAAGLDNSLIVTPLISRQQIGDASIDLRLGNQFIVFRTQALRAYDPYGSDPDIRSLQERQIVRYDREFVLHPGMLTLAATFEYVRMPNDLEGQVEGRSSWARLGLQIATATTVEPGFKGVITLELSNVGTIPLVLRPGVRIAQIIFRDALPALRDAYLGGRKYYCSVGPEFSLIRRDRDAGLFE